MVLYEMQGYLRCVLSAQFLGPLYMEFVRKCRTVFLESVNYQCTVVHTADNIVSRGLWVFGVGLSVDKQMIQRIAPGLSCPDKLLHHKVKTAPWEKVLIPNLTISFSHHLIILRNMITLMFPKHSYLCDQQQIYDHFLKIKTHKPRIA